MRLAVHEGGAGSRTAVLIHGIMSDHRAWHRVSAELQEHGFRIIAVDLSDDRLKQARHFGATEVINSSTEDLAERVAALTEGRGVEVAIEAIGLPKTIEAAYASLARGGRAIVAGQVPDGLTITIDPFVMSDSELKLIGSNYGSSRPSIDFPQLVDHYMHDRIDLDALVTRVIGLEEINDGYDEMKRGVGIRSVIKY